jgi:hypothetical protein
LAISAGEKAACDGWRSELREGVLADDTDALAFFDGLISSNDGKQAAPDSALGQVDDQSSHQPFASNKRNRINGPFAVQKF